MPKWRPDLVDPNGDLSEDELEWARRTAAGPFYRCSVEPRTLTGFPIRPLVIGTLGKRKHLVYARLTRSREEEEGTGPMLPALVDIAREVGAEPHVVRVNLTPAGPGVAFHYWGVEELENLLKANTDEWNAHMLGGKTFADYLRERNGKVSRLDLATELIPKSAGENEKDAVSLVLTVDGSPVNEHVIDPVHLVLSCQRSDERFIFTCDCGEPGCAGIDSGVPVVIGEEFTLWKADGINLKTTFVFDSGQYRLEILRKLRDYLNQLKDNARVPGPSTYLEDPRRLAKALYEAGEASGS